MTTKFILAIACFALLLEIPRKLIDPQIKQGCTLDEKVSFHTQPLLLALDLNKNNQTLAYTIWCNKGM